jgi:hypothetical protein
VPKRNVAAETYGMSINLNAVSSHSIEKLSSTRNRYNSFRKIKKLEQINRSSPTKGFDIKTQEGSIFNFSSSQQQQPVYVSVPNSLKTQYYKT